MRVQIVDRTYSIVDVQPSPQSTPPTIEVAGLEIRTHALLGRGTRAWCQVVCEAIMQIHWEILLEGGTNPAHRDACYAVAVPVAMARNPKFARMILGGFARA